MALLTAKEVAHTQGKKLVAKKNRELKRLSWSLHQVNTSQDKSKGKGIAQSRTFGAVMKLISIFELGTCFRIGR